MNQIAYVFKKTNLSILRTQSKYVDSVNRFIDVKFFWHACCFNDAHCQINNFNHLFKNLLTCNKTSQRYFRQISIVFVFLTSISMFRDDVSRYERYWSLQNSRFKKHRLAQWRQFWQKFDRLMFMHIRNLEHDDALFVCLNEMQDFEFIINLVETKSFVTESQNFESFIQNEMLINLHVRIIDDSKFQVKFVDAIE